MRLRWSMVCAALTFAGCGGAPGAPCDPLGPACSDGTQACYPVLDGKSALCVAPGTAAVGEVCTTPLGRTPECVEGALCLRMASANRCVRFCNPDGGAPGCPGASCEAVIGAAFGACF